MSSLPKKPPRKTLQYQPRRAPPPPKQPTPKPSPLHRSQRIPLALVLFTGTCITGYCVSLYLGAKRKAGAGTAHDVPLDVTNRYRYYANDFDESVDWTEKFGIPWIWPSVNSLRKQLVNRAEGHVLEASVGTGRNGEYYDLTRRVKSITLVDSIPEMLRLARIKWAETNTWYLGAFFWLQDAAEPVDCPHPDGFDDVVQTFGICSTAHPDKVLRNLGYMAKPETGRVYLLEHGRSHYDWLNNLLDSSAPAHADQYGCWWNKDIGEIVKNSGMEIVEQRRYHFGTVWMFVLKPLPRPVEQASEDSNAKGKSKPWWATIWK